MICKIFRRNVNLCSAIKRLESVERCWNWWTCLRDGIKNEISYHCCFYQEKNCVNIFEGLRCSMIEKNNFGKENAIGWRERAHSILRWNWCLVSWKGDGMIWRVFCILWVPSWGALVVFEKPGVVVKLDCNSQLLEMHPLYWVVKEWADLVGVVKATPCFNTGDSFREPNGGWNGCSRVETTSRLVC